jgi:hypothetical protein
MIYSLNPEGGDPFQDGYLGRCGVACKMSKYLSSSCVADSDQQHYISFGLIFSEPPHIRQSPSGLEMLSSRARRSVDCVASMPYEMELPHNRGRSLRSRLPWASKSEPAVTLGFDKSNIGLGIQGLKAEGESISHTAGAL